MIPAGLSKANVVQTQVQENQACVAFEFVAQLADDGPAVFEDFEPVLFAFVEDFLGEGESFVFLAGVGGGEVENERRLHDRHFDGAQLVVVAQELGDLKAVDVADLELPKDVVGAKFASIELVVI